MNLIKSTLTPTSVLLQQIRTTFILKRRWDPPIHKINKKPHKLRGRHFVYDLIEDTLVKPKKNLEVVLTTYVDGVGAKGDVVSLRPTFAYNKLLLPGLAVYKTEENIQKYAAIESDKKEEQHSSPYAQRTVNMLEGLFLSITMNKNVPWVLEHWHIRASLRKAGYICLTDDCITLPEQEIKGPDMNLEGKHFYVTITINNMEKARVKCRIRHWSTDPSEKLPYVFEFWKEPTEPFLQQSE